MERMLYFSGCGKRFHFRCSRITKNIGTLTRGLSGAETPLFQTRPISRNDSLFPERVLWLGTTIELCQLLRRNRKKSARSTSEYTSWPKCTQQTNNKLMTNFHKRCILFSQKKYFMLHLFMMQSYCFKLQQHFVNKYTHKILLFWTKSVIRHLFHRTSAIVLRKGDFRHILEWYENLKLIFNRAINYNPCPVCVKLALHWTARALLTDACPDHPEWNQRCEISNIATDRHREQIYIYIICILRAHSLI